MLTSEQYLCLERNASFKSEFYRGEMFAMAGATHHHNLIVGNLITGLNNLLRQSNCTWLLSDFHKSTIAIPIDCIDCKLEIEDIYFKVDFATKGIGYSESPLVSA